MREPYKNELPSDVLSVTAIKNGTVIDHISAGQALRIIHLLELDKTATCVTIGMHLPSNRLGSKDLIKIENRILTPGEANEIVVFSPYATINVIKDYKVSEKIKTRLPEVMKNVFICPNANCITHSEHIHSRFAISEERKQVKLTCYYCEKSFNRDQLRVLI